jgi:L-lactate dehydrogenase (cytochrome)
MQPLFFQLYVNHDRQTTARLIRKAEAGGCRALFVTVDAPQLGRREKDMRHKFTLAGTAVQSRDDKQGKVERGQGVTRAISQFIDPSFNWADLEWIRSITSMPIVLKGVGCVEDAILAVKHGVAGIVCSNHGGRQLDFARSGIEVLEEVMHGLRAANLQDKLEV